MTRLENETLLMDEPGERRTTPQTQQDQERAQYLDIIIRRALRHPESNSTLSRALRAEAARAASHPAVTENHDEDLRVQQVALRIDALLAQRAAAPTARLPFRETLRQ